MSAEQAELCFVNSNIWIYATTQSSLDSPDPRHRMAGELVKQLRPCLSVQVVNEVAVNLKRRFRFQELELRDLVLSFLENYRVLPLDREILIQGSNLRERYKFSFWDSLIVAAALKGNCTFLYSEDMQDRLIVENELTIINPFFGTSS